MPVAFFPKQDGSLAEAIFDSAAQQSRVTTALGGRYQNSYFATGAFSRRTVASNRRLHGAYSTVNGTWEIVMNLIAADRAQYPNG